MTPEFLDRKLNSNDPRERLDAARYLVDNAKKMHAAQIDAALGNETVPWVRSALLRALQKIRQNSPTKRSKRKQELTVLDTAQIYSNALETTAAQIIHEIEPILGSLRLSAEIEVPQFDGSDTQRGLDRLDALIIALSCLRQAASAPKVRELTLDHCIYIWVDEEISGRSIGLLRAGPQDCLVEGDQGLIYLGFINGLRNAIDATKALSVEDDNYPDIIVNWGTTDIDNWVSIVDSGIGFRGNLTRAFDIGSTTKANHLGMGLATAQQAMTSMDGSVRLIPGERGVRFEMRWPKAGV